MSLLHLTKNDYSVSRWSGGTTTQVAIAPKEAVYAQRDFLWRVSSAAVELEESDFTALPDYFRYISTLQGDMALTHNGGTEIRLSPYQVHAFDGGTATHSRGICTDFNLMLRKEKTAGEIRSLRLSPGSAAEEGLRLPASPFPRAALLVFCGEGEAVLSCEGQVLTLQPFESALLEAPSGPSLTITSESGAALFIAEMHW